MPNKIDIVLVAIVAVTMSACTVAEPTPKQNTSNISNSSTEYQHFNEDMVTSIPKAPPKYNNIDKPDKSTDLEKSVSSFTADQDAMRDIEQRDNYRRR